MKKKLKIILISVTSFVVIIGIVLYLLADRYLIEHVEAVVSTTRATSSSVSTNLDTSSGSTTATSTESVSANNMSYASGTKTISIKKVTTGTGANTLTYYVADVKLSTATLLESALAKNEFGTNIIEYTSTIAKNNNAIFAINGDYYGFRTDGVIIRNGVLYRNKPARIGLAFYKDGSMKIYDETKITAKQLLADEIGRAHV